MVHDASKLGNDEFPGFVRINSAARNFVFGAPEYLAGLRAEKSTIARHYECNDHHPEHYNALAEMGFLALIECVCDWHAAWKDYDVDMPPSDRQTFAESLEVQRKRFSGFTDGQWWLIEQVAAFLEGAE